jgi:hypothetical protein
MTENEVHEHLYKVGFESIVLDVPEFGEGVDKA